MSEERYIKLGEAFADEYGSTSGQMFGKPCLKINKKAYAAFYKGEMVFKIGQEEISLLRENYINSVNWDPSGKNRAMKDWLQVPADYSGDWLGLANQAINYVIGTSKN